VSLVGPSRVFVDSNVLYSRTLRDWLALLSLAGTPPPFTVFWSEDVLAEVMYHLRRNHPDWGGGMVTRVRDLIANTFEGGRVSDYVIDESYQGRDTHDAHVHAAAVACNAEYLLTCNGADFPDDAAPYETISPDDFLTMIGHWLPGVVRNVTQQQMTYWATRRSEALLPQTLEAAGCPTFAEHIRRTEAEIGGVPYIPPVPLAAQEGGS
jgi:predicted nucleic acid-binding protein